MRIPRFVEKKLLGRVDFHEDTVQPAGEGHPVPFYRQRHVNMCGDACVKMLASYYGWQAIHDAIDLKTNPRGITEGLGAEDLLDTYGEYLESVVLPGRRVPVVKTELEDHPLIASGEYCTMGILGVQGHWVVVKGFCNANFYLHDPWHGANFAVSHATFGEKLDTLWRAKADKRDPNAILLAMNNMV